MSEAAPPAAHQPGDGLVVIDKPAGWTSHDVVARCRRLYGTKKVGHAGTLDPMATGVLVLGVGKATKLLTFLVGADKDYSATIRLGQSTITDDAEGEVTESHGLRQLDGQRLHEAVAAFTGEILQVPSSVSAIKVDGKRSYAKVRSGEAVALAARPVTISRFTTGDPVAAQADDGTSVIDLPAQLSVSSGTYIRALARDLGATLGCGGHLTALRRTRVGGITAEHAHDLAALTERVQEHGEKPPLLPLAQAAAAALPVRQISEAQARTLGFGQRIDSGQPGREGPVAAIDPEGQLIAILDESQSQARSLVVFAPASS